MTASHCIVLHDLRRHSWLGSVVKGSPTLLLVHGKLVQVFVNKEPCAPPLLIPTDETYILLHSWVHRVMEDHYVRMYLVTPTGSGPHYNKTALKQAYSAASIDPQRCRVSNTVK